MLRIIRVKQKGFTLIEIVTVLAIFMVIGGVIYSVLITNWKALDDHIARVGMLEEANTIFEILTTDARHARDISVTSSTLELKDSLGGLISNYAITMGGRLDMYKDGATRTMTRNLNPAQSAFIDQDRGVRVQLSFQDDIFGRQITTNATTEVYPRN